ncbi:cytochrome-c peroxidase [Hymenobacter sp. RP-2-7]|uniref:Cytochrome-c peroxidase n=1 Tax=Hymenobacter polaris TaxID=2682546 RepID=A0A7Y0FMX5_9BACT|nr:cytochrome c peroxidase [Hymenobacter polaris]NML66357.1 cytochrome-c peroxidase [Hymenobacter polaris]
MRLAQLIPAPHRPLARLGLVAGLGLAGLLAGAGSRPVAAVPGTAQPANFPPMVYGLAGNPPDAATFALGRQLFYDARLSADGTVSCGSCHRPAAAFAHAGHRLSPGVGRQLAARNAPALQNLRWRRGFMADGGALGLELQALAPLTDPREMHRPLAAALAQLNADADYRRQFAAIYGPGPIGTAQFLRALAQFTAALTSANSRYDHYVRHEAGGQLTSQEISGLALFQAKCAGCHATDLFTDESYRNNGLDRTFPLDSGRARISLKPGDVGRFKVPSLRNVARTAPYMHDGRFGTLGQVLAHYDHGVQPSRTLDPRLRQPNGRLGIPLSAPERANLLAFLRTLTDRDFLTDRRLLAPAPTAPALPGRLFSVFTPAWLAARN